MNGDGYGDVIVQARGPNVFNDAFVFHGSASGIPNGTSDTPYAHLEADTSSQSSDFFGSSVAGAGDVNGDGRADVIVGASGFDHEGTLSHEGAAFVFLSSSEGIGLPEPRRSLLLLGGTALVAALALARRGVDGHGIRLTRSRHASNFRHGRHRYAP